MKHPSSEHLVNTLRPLGSRESALLLHLLRCPSCARRARRWLGGDPLADPRRRKGTVLSEVSSYERLWPGLEVSLRTAASDLAQEREIAPRLAEELFSIPAAERESVLQREARFHTVALGFHLLGTAKTQGLDVRIESAHLAIAIADVLTERHGSQATRAALRSAAGLALAEALRECGELIQAEIELESVAVYLEASADLLDRAHYVRALGLLRRDQQRAEEAFALFDRAADLLSEIGETRAEAEVRLACGELHLDRGDPQEAFDACDAALSALLQESTSSPDLLFRAARGAAFSLVLFERFEEALETLASALPRLVDTPWQLKTLSIRGRIEMALRHHEAAARSFRAAIDGWRRRSEPQAAARSAVWLAEVLVAGMPENDGWSVWFADLVEVLEALADDESLPLEIRTALDRLADGLIERTLPEGLTANLAATLELIRSTDERPTAGERTASFEELFS